MGLFNRFTSTCTHQIQTSLQTDGHCKQHYLHRIRELKTTTWCEVKVQFVFTSPKKKNGDRIQTHANSSDWEQNCILLCMLVFFLFFLFVCMVLIFEQWKYWKMSLFCFQNADLLLLYLTHSFSVILSNMFVTVAVINVKLLAVWGYVAFLHVSILCAVSPTLYGHEWLRQVSGLNHQSLCASVRMWG